MNHRAFSNVTLSDLRPASSLFILGFRACAFGIPQCCRVQCSFNSGLGRDADQALGDVLTFTRAISADGVRKIGLTAPGSDRMTRDEVSIVCVLSAAQAWDEVAVDVHLSGLLAGPVSPSLRALVTKIADTFAGHGLAFTAPAEVRQVSGAQTPSFHRLQ